MAGSVSIDDMTNPLDVGYVRMRLMGVGGGDSGVSGRTNISLQRTPFSSRLESSPSSPSSPSFSQNPSAATTPTAAANTKQQHLEDSKRLSLSLFYKNPSSGVVNRPSILDKRRHLSPRENFSAPGGVGLGMKKKFLMNFLWSILRHLFRSSLCCYSFCSLFD
jgi:hypothetical protein